MREICPSGSMSELPLIEPDRQISRIRLSEKTHMFRVTPSATSEHNLGWLDSSSIPSPSSFLASVFN